MKTASFLSRYLLRTVLVLVLLVAAALVGVGVAGFVAYRQTRVTATPPRPAPRAVVPPAEEIVAPRTLDLSNIQTWEGQAIMMNVSASLAANRFIAAASPDRPQYAYADYQPDGRDGASNAGDVPPSLEPSSSSKMPAAAAARPTLSDPGSRYIMDPNTGWIIGIDGTAGARAEASQQQERQRHEAAAMPPHREREVRAALPVDAPVVSDLPPPKPGMFPAIRRAEPVGAPGADDGTAPTLGGFNANAELIDDRPVFRAQPVTISQPVRTQRRVFALP